MGYSSWILYRNRKHRDAVNKKVMKDKRITPMMDPKKLPFDGKRFFWGGLGVDRRSSKEIMMGNPVVHWELMSKDPGEGVPDFYASIFGWKVQHRPELNYRIVELEHKAESTAAS